METVRKVDAPSVSRRRVFYLPGYDPRRPSLYRDLFASELAKAAALRNFRATAGPLDETDAIAPTFSVEARTEGADVVSHVSILRWDDLIRPAYKLPMLQRLPKLLDVGFDLMRRGTIRRVARLDWQFAAFLVYPYAMTLAAILLVALSGIGAVIVAGYVFSPASLPAGLAAASLAGWLGLRMERALYLRYLLEDWLFSFAHERGCGAVLSERIDMFAQRIVEASADPEIDELLLVGHSSGSFLAPETLARALELNPDLGEGRAEISLLTIGAIASLFLCDRENSRYEAALVRLAHEPGIAWYEIQSRHDVMNMCPVDPIALSGQFPDRAAQWPRVLRLSMPQVVAPGQLGLLRERLLFFRNHFRFVAANERIDWYDFYGMMVGATTLSERLRAVPAIFGRSGRKG